MESVLAFNMRSGSLGSSCCSYNVGGGYYGAGSGGCRNDYYGVICDAPYGVCGACGRRHCCLQ